MAKPKVVTKPKVSNAGLQLSMSMITVKNKPA